MSLEINFGVPEKQRLRVAKILYEAFETKFQRFFGVKHYSSLIAEHLRNDRIVVALSNGVVVGVAGLKFEGKEFLDISFWQRARINEKAKRLYERIGFKVLRMRRIPFPLNRFVGIDSAHEMTYHVQSDFLS